MRMIYFLLFAVLLVPALFSPVYAMDTTWTLVTDHTGFTPRELFSTADFSGKMWVIGGVDKDNKYNNDVWYSSDGLTWSCAIRSAPFTPRYGHTTVVFDDKMWVIGGYDSSHRFRNDVWYTGDGKTWVQATPEAAFQPRLCHSSAVYDGKIWVIGGEVTEHPWVYTNDVWYSNDGINWMQATPEAAFPSRSGHNTIAFDDKIWVIGGVGDAYGQVRYNDVWYSNDGRQWNLMTGSAAFSSRYYFSSLTAGDKIWILGGVDGRDTLNDVWTSADGKKWLPVSSEGNYTPRMNFGAILFRNRIWIIGGRDSTNGVYNDVWRSSELILPIPVDGIVLNKTIQPWSIKEGTTTRVSVTFTNTGNGPLHDIQILDPTLPELPVFSGKNQTVTSQSLMPNETRILVYSIQATKEGRYSLPPAIVLYAGEDGNYHTVTSNSPTIEVIAPLVRQDDQNPGKTGFTGNDLMKSISDFFLSMFPNRF